MTCRQKHSYTTGHQKMSLPEICVLLSRGLIWECNIADWPQLAENLASLSARARGGGQQAAAHDGPQGTKHILRAVLPLFLAPGVSQILIRLIDGAAAHLPAAGCR